MYFRGNSIPSDFYLNYFDCHISKFNTKSILKGNAAIFFVEKNPHRGVFLFLLAEV